MKKAGKVAWVILLTACLLAGCSSPAESQSREEASAASESAKTSDSEISAAPEASSFESSGRENSSAGTKTSEAGSEDSMSTSGEAAASSVTGSSSETGSGILVVYFSATGNTRAVAETIADATGADLFEITPVEPYSDDDLNWSNDQSRVSREHKDESLQNQVELTTTSVDGWDSYETVFLGYPIWWGIAAWPVNQFVQNNDFSGKTVIPFCTSASSGIGESGKLLADMAGTGDWQEGQRFASHPDESDVVSWAQSVLEEK